MLEALDLEGVQDGRELIRVELDLQVVKQTTSGARNRASQSRLHRSSSTRLGAQRDAAEGARGKPREKERRTSTTAPMTCLTLPTWFLAAVA